MLGCPADLVAGVQHESWVFGYAVNDRVPVQEWRFNAAFDQGNQIVFAQPHYSKVSRRFMGQVIRIDGAEAGADHF